MGRIPPAAAGGPSAGRWTVAVAALLAAMTIVVLPRQTAADVWPGFGADPQHTGLSLIPSQPLQRVRWSAVIDLDPRYSGNDLLIHYGTPLVTRRNTVIIPVKTGKTDGFRIDARRGDTGELVWQESTDYSLPPYGWIPSVGATLTPRHRLMFPGAGGTVWRRTLPDRDNGRTRQLAFYGIQEYLQDPSAFNSRVKISTPITASRGESLYFGFVATSGAPLGLQSGVALSAPGRRSRWISAADAAGDPRIRKVVYNCAPALSADRSLIYVAVTEIASSGFGVGYLVALDSRTLDPVARVRLKDVVNPQRDAVLPDDGSSSPTIGPDGDVYFGVLESPLGSNHLRGWMLHFDAQLSQTKAPGAYGWDNTPSIVPASAVPSYSGGASYLLLTKYQNYATTGGDGVNRMALLDPTATMTDPISGATVMREVLTVAGPTPDEERRDEGYPNAVKEWCVNASAVDLQSGSAFMSNEDGVLYRWDFATNALTESVRLTDGLLEGYTPTVIGADGTVYAINSGMLFAVGE